MSDYKIQPIANSLWMAKMMRKSPVFEEVARIPVLPPIVDSQFTIRLGRELVRKALGCPENHFLIGLSASSLTDPGKGISEFFDELPSEAHWLDQVSFLLIGDGTVEIPKGVSAHFTGRITDAERLAELYGACDLFVSPSFMESFGMAILEAQACGTPTLAFSAGGTPEAIYPSAPCQLVENRNFAALYEAIENAVCVGPVDGSVRERLSSWVRGRHSANFIAKKQIAIYEECE